LTPAATRQSGPEFGHKHPIHLSVRVARAEERDEFFRSVAPIHVEDEQTAVLAADVARHALQLSPIMVPGRAVASYESPDVGHERYDAIRIEVVCTQRFGPEVYS